MIHAIKRKHLLHCTFECGLLEDLHGIELVSIRGGYLSHQEHLQWAQQKPHKPPLYQIRDWESKSAKEKGKKRNIEQREQHRLCVTLPKDPCPKTLSSSNWEASAFSEPSLTTWVMLISLMSPSSWRVQNRGEIIANPWVTAKTTRSPHDCTDCVWRAENDREKGSCCK